MEESWLLAGQGLKEDPEVGPLRTGRGAGLGKRRRSQAATRPLEQRAKQIVDENEMKHSSAGQEGGAVRLCMLCVFVGRSWPTDPPPLLNTPTKSGSVEQRRNPGPDAGHSQRHLYKSLYEMLYLQRIVT